uniref:Uncharacterized protein n=1 Tax=Ciona savignyi TaxID=51511 RepID=H2ZL05_CIOSA
CYSGQPKLADMALFEICQGYTTSILVVLLAVMMIYRWHKQKYKNLPPGPTGVPILGCLPFMDTLAELTFTKWSKKYGPIFTVYLGQTRVVVLNSFEAIEEALINQGDKFTGRVHNFFTNFSNNGHGLFFIDGEKWTIQRKFGTRALAGAGVYGKTYEQRVLEEAAHLIEVFRSKDEKPFSIEVPLISAVANVINGITIQEKCNEEGNERLQAYVMEVIEGFRRDGILYSLLLVMPWCRFIPFMKKRMKVMSEGIRLGNDIFATAIEQHEKHHDAAHPRDLVDLFINEMHRNRRTFEVTILSNSFQKTQLQYFLKDLFAAGTETSTSTIIWALYYLIRHPEIQDKVHREIDAELGKARSREGKLSLKTNLPYTKAVLQETYRIRTATPLAIPRRTREDVNLMGYSIPKDTQIISNLWWVHNDPEHWDEPDVFRPERHLDTNGNLVMLNRVIPFSIGPRNCLGENLARIEIYLFLVSILQKFVVLPNPDDPNPPMTCNPGAVNAPSSYNIVLKER